MANGSPRPVTMLAASDINQLPMHALPEETPLEELLIGAAPMGLNLLVL